MESPTALLPNVERTGVADCLFRFDRREAGEDIAAEVCSSVLGKEAEDSELKYPWRLQSR